MNIELAPAPEVELFIAIVRPVGIPDTEFHEALSASLQGYGYQIQRIKLSALLADDADRGGTPIPARPEHERLHALMDKGDGYCRDLQEPAAVALMGIAEVQRLRTAARQGPTSPGRSPARVAYVLDSLKRPDEVVQLRRIYGDRLLLIALQAEESRRKTQLSNLIRAHSTGLDGKIDTEVARLIERDLNESGDEYTQNLLKTFPLADVFIDIEKEVSQQVQRIFDLLFGSPVYSPPSDAEFGMNLAYLASTRSAELGLKVGAAVLRNGAMLALGANEPPVSKEAPTYDPSAAALRDLVLDTVTKLAPTFLTPEAQSALEADGDSFVRTLLDGPLKRAQIRDLTEFQEPVHAEMSALLDAARKGLPLDNATVYVTAYPCHNCAKHLVALDLEVRYIEPYPKSRAESMYGDSVRRTFAPFTGIAPRRYRQLFSVGGDRKSHDGSRKEWSTSQKAAARPRLDERVGQETIEVLETAALQRLRERLQE